MPDNALFLYAIDPMGPRNRWVPATIRLPRLSGWTLDGVLYRFFNRDRELLYIGVTSWSSRTPIRWIGHQKSAGWWPDVAYFTLTRIRYDGSGWSPIERAAIRCERPRFNTIHNKRRTRIELRLDEGPAAVVKTLRYHLFPEDFAALVEAFTAEARSTQDL